MRLDRGLLGWGLFLILLGAVPLGVRAGVIPEEFASRAWQLWPLIIVAIGLSVVARGSRLEDLAGLVFPVVFGLMIGGALATGSVPFGGCGDDRGAGPFETQSGTLGETATVDIEMGCGDLELVAVSGSDWQVAGSDDDGDGPRVGAETDSLEIRQERGFGFFDARSTWQVELPTTPRLSLEASLNAGAARLVLGGATLGPVSLDVNAGEARLDLGVVSSINGPLAVEVNAGEAVVILPDQSLTGELDVNAGSIVVCTPPTAGIRITTNENITASFDFESRGLVRSGNTWETPGFAEAAVRIELRAEANAASVTLDRQPDCTAPPQA